MKILCYSIMQSEKIGNLAGKRVLITGATGGIGKAIAEAFYKEGTLLCLSGRKKDILESLKELYPERCSVWPLDLSHGANIINCIRQIETNEGSIDILVNNGGITEDKLSFQMDDMGWDQILQINLTAAFQLSREVCKGMMRKKWGRIINIASIVALMGNRGQVNYAAAKAGMIGMTKTMALELARWNITVNAIAPGYIETAMTKNIPSSIVESIPCQRFGSPEDIAYGALFLADARANYITGETLHINGGLGRF